MVEMANKFEVGYMGCGDLMSSVLVLTYLDI